VKNISTCYNSLLSSFPLQVTLWPVPIQKERLKQWFAKFGARGTLYISFFRDKLELE